MELEGRVWKDENSSWWLAEVSFLDVMTQGKTKKKALEMLEDAILELY
jgi:predicted RNase H-like HicB family nuclease